MIHFYTTKGEYMRNLKRTVATTFMAGVLAVGSLVQTASADNIKLRLSNSGSNTDERALAFEKVFKPAVSSFANFEGHWSSSLFKQGTELEAMARGNLEMALVSSQELAEFIPEFSIFSAGYVQRDEEHQLSVFNDSVMDPLKNKLEKMLKTKLLAVAYFGKRQLNLRTDDKIETPADLKGVNLRMPGTNAWQFLGKALGASPTPMAFTEVYTGLQTGAIDGQDNPIPTTVNKKFYEVTKQIVLTSHLVDLNYVAVSLKTWNKLSKNEQALLQKAATDAASEIRKNILKKEKDLISFVKEKGLKVYEPNVKAFREHAQKMYLNSKYSKTWQAGMLEKINAL